MDSNHHLIEKFYHAFQTKDYRTMQSLYHDDATFSDPVFQNLNVQEVRAMWEMLVSSSTDLKIIFDSVYASSEKGSCHWEAWYTFSQTKRSVHNIIDASFTFRDGKIIRHTDHFNFYRWCRQALGLSGTLLGWSGLIQNKIRKTARGKLNKFMRTA
jgi:ketosteroid isomerase-like protein